MVNDVSAAATQLNLARSRIFPGVYQYLASLGLNEEQQEVVSSAKIVFPFERISTISSLTTITTVPPREDFASLLRAEDTISIDLYDLFCRVWQILNADNMLTMFTVYVALDTLYLGDVLAFYFERIFNVTELYPLWYRTISGLALDSALLHSKDPVKKNSLLKLPLLSSGIYEKFKVKIVIFSLYRLRAFGFT